MSGAQSWSVKGIDPKIREAAREAAARQGMTLGEYLSQALAGQQPAPGFTPPQQQPQGSATSRLRAARLGSHQYDEDEEDWHVSGPAQVRSSDPARLTQRIDAIERRTQLAVSGLDRAVSTIDRSVLGLSARIDDAEAMSSEAADRIAEALEHFRMAGDTLSGKLAQAEQEIQASRAALSSATTEISGVRAEFAEARARLEAQAATADDVVRRAEAAASFLNTELESRDVALGRKLDTIVDRSREELAYGLTKARDAAQDAAREATAASAEAMAELRALQHRVSAQVDDAYAEARSARNALTEEVVRLESEIGARIATADQLRTEQAQLISRVEKAEANARESTAGLRQAAGAAIADLRNAQLGLAARIKQVEEGASRPGAIDLADVRSQQAEISARLGQLEQKVSPVDSALAAFEQRIEAISQRVGDPSAFEQKLEAIAERVAKTASNERIEEVGGAVRTIDESLQRLAARLAETETTANTAIRTLEETVSGLGARMDGQSAQQETEAVRAMLEQRLDQMTQSVTEMVDHARTEFAGQISAVIGGDDGEGFEGALADVNRRLAAAERRQAQTIEAISIEIKRMSETVDRRLRTVESKADQGDAGQTVREELSRMASTLEARFEEIERREAGAFDRMGLEVGRLSERLEDRVGQVENRSAQAIEQVGEQVARMADRFNQRHDLLARELGERMIDSEERSGARVSDAISSIMQRIGEVEERSAEAVGPVQKVVSSVASRLEALENNDIPTPARRNSDYDAPESYVSPMQSAAPLRAGPLPPRTSVIDEHESDIYFADEDDFPENFTDPSAPVAPPTPTPQHALPQASFDSAIGDDDLLVDDAFFEQSDAFAPPPPEDDDPFWTPGGAPPAAAAEAAPATIAETDMFGTLDDDVGAPVAATTSFAIDSDLSNPEPIDPPTPAGKNDYLSNARKAAQAQSLPKNKEKAVKTKGRKDKDNAEETREDRSEASASLRGSSRIVLWTAASAITLLVAGGAWYLNKQQEVQDAPGPSEAEPQAAPLTDTLPPPVEPYDPAAPLPGVDPEAQGGVEGVAPEPAGAEAAAPLASNEATRAGPLAPRAAVSLETAARNGELVALYELGLQRITAGRSDEGVGLLRRAADRGLAMAQYRMGKLYERGEGVPADLNMARQWTERAAAAGNRRAMHDLGVYFARGEGAPLDEAAAFRWFRQAAELGVADSQYNLGVLYQQGRGVGASPAEAMFWFMVAARQGDADASARAQSLEATLAPIQIEQARARAEAFRPRAASAMANGEFGARPWAPAAPRTGA